MVAVLAASGWLLVKPGRPVETAVPSDNPTASQLPATSAATPTALPNRPLPAYYRRVHARAGLTVAIPVGWTVKALAKPHEMRASDPAKPHRWVQYGGYTREVPRSQLVRVLQYERVKPTGYVRLKLNRVQYGHAADAVDWEYTYTAGGAQRHAAGRYWRVGDRKYVVYANAPLVAWPDTHAVLREMLETASPQ